MKATFHEEQRKVMRKLAQEISQQVYKLVSWNFVCVCDNVVKWSYRYFISVIFFGDRQEVIAGWLVVLV